VVIKFFAHFLTHSEAFHERDLAQAALLSRLHDEPVAFIRSVCVSCLSLMPDVVPDAKRPWRLHVPVCAPKMCWLIFCRPPARQDHRPILKYTFRAPFSFVCGGLSVGVCGQLVTVLGQQMSMRADVLRMLVTLYASSDMAVRSAANTVLRVCPSVLLSLSRVLIAVGVQTLAVETDAAAFDCLLMFAEPILRGFLFGPVLQFVRRRQIDDEFRVPFEWSEFLRKKLTRYEQGVFLRCAHTHRHPIQEARFTVGTVCERAAADRCRHAFGPTAAASSSSHASLAVLSCAAATTTVPPQQRHHSTAGYAVVVTARYSRLSDVHAAWLCACCDSGSRNDLVI
jgi:hypothetical protein